MSAQDLKLALEIAAKTTGREDISALANEIETIGPVSNEVEKETQALATKMQELANQRDLINQFNQAKESLTQLELATALSRDKLEQHRKSQSSSTTDAATFAERERLLAGEVKQLERQLISQAATYTKLSVSLKESGVDTNRLASEQNRLQREITQTTNRVSKLASDFGLAGDKSVSFGTQVGSLAGRISALIGTYLGVQTLKDQLISMFSSGDQAERLSVQLKAVMGSISGGEQATSWIQSFAKNTPLQLDEVTQVFVRLKAFGLDPMDGSMQGVVDQAYKLGGGFEEVQGVSLALGQAWAKQKLQGEEILQLIERGVPVWEMLEKVTGKNTQELQKLSESGQLGRDVIRGLMNEMAQESAGAAADNMSLLSGLISNARDNLETFYRMVASSGSLDWLKQQLSNLNAEFNRLMEDGTLKKWAQDISDGIISAGEAIKQFFTTLSDWKSQIITVGQAWATLKIANWTAQTLQFAASWKNVSASIATSSPAIAALSNPIVAVGVALAGATKLALDLAKATFDLTEGQDIKNRNAEREREFNQQLIQQGQQLMAQNGQYADLQYQSADAIAAMSDADRERYKQALEGNKNYIAGQISVNAALERTGNLSSEQKQQTQSDTAAMRQAFADLAAGEQQHLALASKSLNDYVNDIQKAKSEAEGLANSSLGNVFKTAGLDFEQISGRVGTTVQTFVNGLQQMEQATSITGPAISAYLTKAFDSAKNQSEIDALIGKMDNLHSQGKLVGDDYIAALGAAADKTGELAKTNSAYTEQQINLLKQQREAAQQAYSTSGLDKYQTKVGQLNQQIERLVNAQNKNTNAANETETAYKELGMQSAAHLQELADKAEAAYSKISSSGDSSLSQQQEAFLKYAEASVTAAQASGSLPPALLDSQAAALGLTEQLDALKTRLSTVGGESLITANALKSMGAAAGSASSGVSKAGDATSSMKSGHDDLNKSISSSEKALKEFGDATSSWDGWNSYIDKQHAAAGAVKTYSMMVPAIKAVSYDAAKATDYMSMSMNDLQKEVRQNAAAMASYQMQSASALGPSGVEQWVSGILGQSAAAKKLQTQLAAAVLDIRRLQEGLSENPSEALIIGAERALKSHKNLDEQTLSGLRSAIDSAKQSMDSLNQSAKSTLSSLQDEMDSINANNNAIEERRYQNQLAELDNQLAEARKTQNMQAIADLQESKQLAQQIHDKKMSDIKAESDAAKKAKQQEAEQSPATRDNSNIVSTSNVKLHKVDFNSEYGNASVTVKNPAELDNLLELLKYHGLRTSK